MHWQFPVANIEEEICERRVLTSSPVIRQTVSLHFLLGKVSMARDRMCFVLLCVSLRHHRQHLSEVTRHNQDFPSEGQGQREVMSTAVYFWRTIRGGVDVLPPSQP